MARLELTGLRLHDDLDEKPGVTVTLSKRNLLALLHKVDQDWSQKTISNDYVHLGGELLDTGLVDFWIVAEPDEEHYANRAAPGSMIRETEAFIASPTVDTSVLV